MVFWVHLCSYTYFISLTGVCQCTGRWTGDDCSVVPPDPTIDVVDIRTCAADTDFVEINGQNFYEANSLICHYRAVQV